LLLIVGGALLAVGLYVLYLDHLVVKQFEGRRWTLPAQVYAAPLELYAGLPLTPPELEHELQRLHYRRADRPDHPGTYRLTGEHVELALRPARFADETRAAQRLTITVGAKGIETLSDGAGHELPVLRLEPLLIGSIFPIHGEDRIVLSPEEVPPLLPEALKAVEDRKFDTHHGVDPFAMLRAAWVNVRAGQIEQGGSTLTQQLVRSYFLSSRQTLSRKLREAVMAIALDAHFTKADLMNAYINEIFLGQDGDRAIHGFGLASQFYFGKPLSELELSELSLLVAVVRGPSYYDPRWPMPPRLCIGRSVSPRAQRVPITPRTSISCAGRCGATITSRTSPRPGCASTRASIRGRRMRPSTRSSTSWRASIGNTRTARRLSKAQWSSPRRKAAT